MKIKLDPEHAKALTFQQYPPPEQIEGVLHVPLTRHRSLEGWFMEYLRLTGGNVEALPMDFQVRQISLSRAVAGRINAFHLHPKQIQDELWTVADGAMLVWLVDVRVGSPTLGVKRSYILSADQPALLHVPAGVAHGYKAGPEGALLIYTMNSQFDPADPNEGRLGWDYFGKELWEEDRG